MFYIEQIYDVLFYVMQICCIMFFLYSFWIIAKEFDIGNCKDQFRLRSNTGMDPGPRSPNNEFVECRKKS